MSDDFSGLRVVSFESRRAFEMESLIERNGGRPLAAPSMREIPFEANREALEFAAKVMEGKADVVILMTGVGTKFLLQVIESRYPKEDFIKALSKTLLVARGPKPVLALKEMKLAPGLTAPEPNTWREVLSVLDKGGPIKDRKVFVQEYGIQNREFLAELKKRGAHVARVPVYRWALPEDLSTLRRAILEICDGHADVLMFTNATQIHHLLQVAGEEGLESSLREALEKVVVASIGPVVTENLRETGLPVDFESSDSKMGLFVKEASLKCPGILKKKRESWQEKTRRVQVKIYEAKPYAADLCKDSVFLKACRREKTPYTPVWLMRQAGRYMKDYRDLRSRVGFLELCKNPDLACEVTVTAQEKLGADAAILFSDILLILEPMGVGLEYSKGDGPGIFRPVRTAEDIDRLQEVRPQESLAFVYEAVKKIRTALNSKIPLIGFAGAPFTLVSYMAEGRGSENYIHTKSLMYRDPGAWRVLMQKAARSTLSYVNGQIEAGVQAIQIFDSWVGCLSPEDYRTCVLPYMKELFSGIPAGVPVIHFGTGTAALLKLMREAGGSVIGLDWRVDLGEAWACLGDVSIQGNLDPMVLLADARTLREKTEQVLGRAAGRPGHIFNLGHGVLPQTPFENAKTLVELVHEISSKDRISD